MQPRRVQQSQALVSGGRGTTCERGYDHHWKRLRKRYIREHPFCVKCKPPNVIGNEVDHIIPIAVRPELRLDEANLQTLCFVHHRIKTADDLKRYGSVLS